MSALDLDKRKVFSILERRAKLIEDSDTSKKVREIKLCLERDLYKDGVAMLKNEALLEDILLFIEEQTDHRFTYRVGSELQVVDTYSEEKFNETSDMVDATDFEITDRVYTVLFNPKIRAIHPKTLIDRTELFYITQDGENFYYEGNLLELGKTTNYYKAFCILYSIVPDGGRALYKDLVAEARKRSLVRKTMFDEKVVKWIQDNLTGTENGFLKKANITQKLSNDKYLFETVRTVGINFNNRK